MSKFFIIYFTGSFPEHNTPSARSRCSVDFTVIDRHTFHKGNLNEVRAVSLSPFLPRYVPTGYSKALWNDDPSSMAVAFSQCRLRASCHRCGSPLLSQPTPSNTDWIGIAPALTLGDFNATSRFRSRGADRMAPDHGFNLRVWCYLYPFSSVRR